jgi:hypothetical protein
MRMVVLTAAAMLAAPAFGQAALDGKATLSGKAAEALGSGISTKEQVRGVIIAAIGDGLSPEESDFFKEVAAGGAVDTFAAGKTVRVGPLTGDALAIAKLLIAPPNLNTLWKSHGEPILQMVEMSRWGDFGRNRVTGFMANQLYAAWARSEVRTAYRDWVSEYAGVTNAMDTIADPAVKTEAKLLLKAAVEQVFAKCKADGREPPPLFLYDLPLISVGVPMPK